MTALEELTFGLIIFNAHRWDMALLVFQCTLLAATNPPFAFATYTQPAKVGARG